MNIGIFGGDEGEDEEGDNAARNQSSVDVPVSQELCRKGIELGHDGRIGVHYGESECI